jgi:hypothetical protein
VPEQADVENTLYVTVPPAVVVAPVRTAESLAEPPAEMADAERVVMIEG